MVEGSRTIIENPFGLEGKKLQAEWREKKEGSGCRLTVQSNLFSSG